ncbi:MAG: hypothetical protein AAB267_00185 [Candidatus Desantisbacteria bacterium]
MNPPTTRPNPLITKPGLKEIQDYIQSAKPHNVWVVESGRDSSPGYLSDSFCQWLLKKHQLILEKRYSPIDKTTIAIKKRLFGRDIYKNKLTIYCYQQKR